MEYGKRKEKKEHETKGGKNETIKETHTRTCTHRHTATDNVKKGKERKQPEE